jgi:hypothetical protein
MATFQFLDSNGLYEYHTLIKQYIDTADQLSIKYITFVPAASGTPPIAANPVTINFWKVDPTSSGATPAYTVTLPDASTLMLKVTGSHQNEVAILDANGQVTYSSLLYTDIVRKSADAGATFTAGQALIFGTDTASGAPTVKGIDLAASNVTYDNTTSELSATNTQSAIDEVSSNADAKAVYMTETPGGSGDLYSKRYGIYQGSAGSSSSPVPAEKLGDIDIPKDMVVESGSVVQIFFDDSDNTLHEGSISGPDVTEAIMGEGVTPTAADAGAYIKLIISNSSSTALYIKATDLIDIYTGGTTADGTIAVNDYEITFTLSQSVHDSLALADTSFQKGWTTTTPTSGNLVKFDANGKAIDTGVVAPASGSTINTDSFSPIPDATIDDIVDGSYTPTT